MNTILYQNGTLYEVKVKTQSGKITIVPPRAEALTDKSDPFTKRKFPTTGWRKF